MRSNEGTNVEISMSNGLLQRRSAESGGLCCITKVSFLLINTIAALIYLTIVMVTSVVTDESAKALEQESQATKETAEVFNSSHRGNQ